MTSLQDRSITCPHPNDILTEKNGRVVEANHDGNVFFLKLVISEHNENSSIGPEILKAMETATKVVKKIHSLDPPGRFLKRVSNVWRVMGMRYALSTSLFYIQQKEKANGKKRAQNGETGDLRNKKTKSTPIVEIIDSDESCTNESYVNTIKDDSPVPHPPLARATSNHIPTRNDFLFAPEGNTHPGNMIFHQVMEKHKLEYLNEIRNASSDNIDNLRNFWARKIIINFQAKSIPPGLFLEKRKFGIWADIGYEKAIEITEQMLSVECFNQASLAPPFSPSVQPQVTNTKPEQTASTNKNMEQAESQQSSSILDMAAENLLGKLNNSIKQDGEKLTTPINTSPQRDRQMMPKGIDSITSKRSDPFIPRLSKNPGPSALAQQPNNTTTYSQQLRQKQGQPQLTGLGGQQQLNQRQFPAMHSLPLIQTNNAVQINQNTIFESEKLSADIEMQIKEVQIDSFQARQKQQQYATQHANAEEYIQLLKTYQTQMKSFRIQFQQQQNAEKQQQLFNAFQSQFQFHCQQLQIKHNEQIIRQQQTHREEIKAIQKQNKQKEELELQQQKRQEKECAWNQREEELEQELRSKEEELRKLRQKKEKHQREMKEQEMRQRPIPINEQQMQKQMRQLHRQLQQRQQMRQQQQMQLQQLSIPMQQRNMYMQEEMQQQNVQMQQERIRQPPIPMQQQLQMQNKTIRQQGMGQLPVPMQMKILQQGLIRLEQQLDQGRMQQRKVEQQMKHCEQKKQKQKPTILRQATSDTGKAKPIRNEVDSTASSSTSTANGASKLSAEIDADIKQTKSMTASIPSPTKETESATASIETKKDEKDPCGYESDDSEGSLVF